MQNGVLVPAEILTDPRLGALDMIILIKIMLESGTDGFRENNVYLMEYTHSNMNYVSGSISWLVHLGYIERFYDERKRVLKYIDRSGRA